MSNNRDYESGFNRNSRDQQQVFPSFDMPMFQGRFPFTLEQGGDPRQQNFCHFLKYVFCPKLTLWSFTSIIVIVNVMIFAFTCYIGLKIPGTLLQIDDNLLKRIGNHPDSIYHKNQVWRWVSACFLHADFQHLFFNSICILIIGSMVEKAQGKWETFLVYITSGICGNIFSSVVTQDTNVVSVGASTCIYGLMAALVGFMILNWDAMKEYSTSRNYIMCFLCLVIVLVIFMSMGPSEGDTQLDYNGHMGGFIGGLFLSLCLFSPLYNNSYEQKCKVLGYILSTFLFGIMLLIFYTTKFSSGESKQPLQQQPQT